MITYNLKTSNLTHEVLKKQISSFQLEKYFEKSEEESLSNNQIIEIIFKKNPNVRLVNIQKDMLEKTLETNKNFQGNYKVKIFNYNFYFIK
jgi:hypothetical protein